MTNSKDPRVDAMFSSDRMWAWIAILALWALYAFTFWQIMPLVADSNVLMALAISAGLVLLFNTAAIIAMTSHYADDRDHIYGLDLYYLDLMNKRKG